MSNEIIANIHIHTIYSDGTKTHMEIAKIAAECGIDAIIINDHNIHVKGFDGYIHHKGKNVLVITGEEIHDKKRIPQKNHLLTIGVNRSFTELASNTQTLIDAVKSHGGLSFIAHAVDPALSIFDEENLSWEDWSVTGFDGMEIWNNLSEFKFRVKNNLQAVFYAFFPYIMSVKPPQPLLDRWDLLLNENHRLTGIGGADAHTFIFKIGAFTKEVFPYRYHFKTINTHILLNETLSGDAVEDTKNIIDSLKRGSVFTANDHINPSFGFRFIARSGEHTTPMGSDIQLAEGIRLCAQLPYKADIFLRRNGEIIMRSKNANKLNFKVMGKGVYRLECYRKHFFKKRGWIFSNPIYVV